MTRCKGRTAEGASGQQVSDLVQLLLPSLTALPCSAAAPTFLFAFAGLQCDFSAAAVFALLDRRGHAELVQVQECRVKHWTAPPVAISSSEPLSRMESSRARTEVAQSVSQSVILSHRCMSHASQSVVASIDEVHLFLLLCCSPCAYCMCRWPRSLSQSISQSPDSLTVPASCCSLMQMQCRASSDVHEASCWRCNPLTDDAG